MKQDVPAAPRPPSVCSQAGNRSWTGRHQAERNLGGEPFPEEPQPGQEGMQAFQRFRLAGKGLGSTADWDGDPALKTTLPARSYLVHHLKYSFSRENTAQVAIYRRTTHTDTLEREGSVAAVPDRLSSFPGFPDPSSLGSPPPTQWSGKAFAEPVKCQDLPSIWKPPIINKEGQREGSWPLLPLIICWSLLGI